MKVTNTGLVIVSFPPLLQWREQEQTDGSSVRKSLDMPMLNLQQWSSNKQTPHGTQASRVIEKILAAADIHMNAFDVKGAHRCKWFCRKTILFKTN